MIEALVAAADSLVLKPRCCVLYDVIARDGAGQDAVVVSGLDEHAARELYRTATGREWTREALRATSRRNVAPTGGR